MLPSDEVVGVGEAFCVSDLAETLSVSSAGDGDKTSIVEDIVGFCSDTGAVVDISMVDVPFGEGFVVEVSLFGVAVEAGHVPTDGSLV